LRMPQPGREGGNSSGAPRGSKEGRPPKREHTDEKLKKEKDKSHKGKADSKKDRKDRKESKAGKDPGPTRRLSPNPNGHNQFDLPSRAELNLKAAQAKALADPKALSGTAGGIQANGKKGKDKGKDVRRHLGWLWWLKLVAGIIFAAGYTVGVVYLAFEVIKAKATAATGDDIPACKRLQCPSDSVCVDRTGHGHAMCSENSYQNLQILQIVLGIIVGVPSVICLPCSVQWIVQTGGPWLCTRYMNKKRQMRVDGVGRASQRASSREVSSTESPRGDEDLEPGELQELTEGQVASKQKGGLLSRLLGWRRKPKAASPDVPGNSVGAPDAGNAIVDVEVPLEAAAADDDMDIFFAPTQKKKKDQGKDDAPAPGEDDFLDLIFASRRNLDNAPPPLPPPDAPLEPPDEDLRDDDPGLDALFAKPVKAPAPKTSNQSKARGGDIVPDEEGFDDFFHRPPRRAAGALPAVPAVAPGRGTALPPMPSSAPTRQRAPDEISRTEFSAGLSCIFAAAKGGPGSRMSAGSRPQSRVADSMASSAQEEEDYDDEEYDDDEDYGEAPDFIGFALGIARATARIDENSSVAQGSDIFGASAVALGADWDDARSDASGASGVDSLADLEASSLSDLFHPAV